jgi:hypothetical protein
MLLGNILHISLFIGFLVVRDKSQKQFVAFLCIKDPFQMRNLSGDPAYRVIKQRLSGKLTAYLKKTGDPRETSKTVSWNDWPCYGRNDWKVTP